MGQRKLPDHIPGTLREWKQRKRREWKAVVKAVETFRLGCAYTPADKNGNYVLQLEKLVKQITDELSFAKWGH